MESPDLTLYHLGAACSLAALLALEESGRDYRLASPFTPEGEKGADFLAANPTGQVPCLLVDGRPLTETSAILLFLARRFPDRSLLPLTGEVFHDAGIEAELIFCSAGIQPWVRQIVMPRYFMDDPQQWNRVQQLGRLKLHERLSVINSRLPEGAWRYGEWSVIDGYLFWLTMNAVLEGVEQRGIERCIGNAVRTLARPALLAATRRTELAQARLFGADSQPSEWARRLSPRPALDRFCKAMAQPLLPV
jgi:glutathione S-transferase